LIEEVGIMDKKQLDRLEKVEAVTKRIGKKTPGYIVVINPSDTYEDQERKLEELRRAWDEYGEPPEYPIIIIGGSHLEKPDDVSGMGRTTLPEPEK
jgi:thiamine monophosphate synthase